MASYLNQPDSGGNCCDCPDRESPCDDCEASACPTYACALTVVLDGITFPCGCQDPSPLEGGFIQSTDVAVNGTYTPVGGSEIWVTFGAVARYHNQTYSNNDCSTLSTEIDRNQTIGVICDETDGNTTFTILVWDAGGNVESTFYATGVQLDVPTNNQIVCNQVITLPLDTPPHFFGGPGSVFGVAQGGTVTISAPRASVNYSYDITSPGFGVECGTEHFTDSGTIEDEGVFPWYPNTVPGSFFMQDPTIIGPCRTVTTPCRGPINCNGTDYYYHLEIAAFWDEGASCWKCDFTFRWYTDAICQDSLAFSIFLNEEQSCLTAHDIRGAGANTNVVDYGTYSADISASFV